MILDENLLQDILKIVDKYFKKFYLYNNTTVLKNFECSKQSGNETCHMEGNEILPTG